MKKYIDKIIVYTSILILFIVSGRGYAVDFKCCPELVELVDVMVREDGYPRAELENILAGATLDKAVIGSMNHQYEVQPWHKYRKLFINGRRITRGVAYWDKHESTLQRAAETFGVAPAIIVALIGVETDFGTRLGGKRVLDSLVTLTANYPRRSKYFGKELRVFLNTARAENIAPESVVGSFAGAIGIPQFMPSSYQAYAVDFNGNGRRDLVTETEDAIGSVANYLKQHGWRKGQAIFVSLSEQIPKAAIALVSKRAKPKLTVGQLKAAGVDFNARNGSKKMALLRLQDEQGYRYIIGFNNFYAITRYNPSVNYAMAVVELSRQISQRRAQ